MKKVYIVAVANGWNEAKNLPQTLFATSNQQNINFKAKVYVDDGSWDKSAEIAESLGWTVIKSKIKHKESRVASSWISKLINAGLKKLYKLVSTFDYLLIAPCDIILPSTYVSTITSYLTEEINVKIASGTIQNEPSSPTAARGAGRIYDGSFFMDHIQFFPEITPWESWALLHARSLGYATKVYFDSEVVMSPLRQTKNWKVGYGRAMRQLGYFPPYAFVRALMRLPSCPVESIKSIVSYLCTKNDGDHVSKQMTQHLRCTQSKTVLHLLSHPWVAVKRGRYM